MGSTADPTWDDMPAALVSVAELMAGFLAASIPTYRPLWRRIFSQDEKRNTASTNGTGSSGEKCNSSERGPWTSTMKTQTKVSTGVGMSRARTISDSEGISVTRDIELTTQHMVRASRDDERMRVHDAGSDDTLRGPLSDYYG